MSTYGPDVCTCRDMTSPPCPTCAMHQSSPPAPETTVEAVIRISRDLRPNLWLRTEQVARIIDPAAFADGWVIHPPEAAKLHGLKLQLMRATAMRKAQDVLEYLGVNTSTDWYEVLQRMAEEGR